MEEEKKKQLFCAGLRTWGWSLASGVNKSVRVCALTLQIPQTHTLRANARPARPPPPGSRQAHKFNLLNVATKFRAHAGALRPTSSHADSPRSRLDGNEAPRIHAQRRSQTHKSSKERSPQRSLPPFTLSSLAESSPPPPPEETFDLGEGKKRMTDSDK